MDLADLVHARRVDRGSESRLMGAIELDAPAKPWTLARWLRDPFVHFLAIGLAILALYTLVSPPRERSPTSRIELTQDDLRQIQVAWTAKWERAPTAAEMRDLVAEKVREEVLYREALAMGLDQDDTIVKRRMAQKLEFLTEDVAAIRDPTPAELRAWYSANAAQFSTPGRTTFRHVYFSPDKRGARAQIDARAALALLSDADTNVTRLGDAFFDHDYYADRTPDQVAAIFGTSFSKSITTLKPGTWQGPLQSGIGWHLVRVDSAKAGQVPAFADVDRGAVKDAWIDAQRADAKRRAYDAMRAKYEVVLPGAATP